MVLQREPDTRPAASPQLQFADLTAGTPEFRAWMRFRDALLAASIEPDGTDRLRVPRSTRHSRPGADWQRPGTRLVIWRLVAANNREVATSGTWFPACAMAREHAERSIRQASGAERWKATSGEAHGWFLSHRGRVLVLCGRWFGSARDRDRSLDSAVGMLQAAFLGDGLAEPGRITAPPLRGAWGAHHEQGGEPPLIGTGIRTPIKEIARHRWSRR